MKQFIKVTLFPNIDAIIRVTDVRNVVKVNESVCKIIFYYGDEIDVIDCFEHLLHQLNED